MTSPVTRPRHGDIWTVDDIWELPRDGQQYEVFDGSLLVSPHADVFHGAVANRLRRLLDRQAPPDLLVGQDIGVSARRSSYFVPDVFVARESAGGVYREVAVVTPDRPWSGDEPFPLTPSTSPSCTEAG